MWAMAVCAVAAVLVWLAWRGSGVALSEFLGIGLVCLYARLWHRCSVEGARSLQRPILLIANHSSSADPAFLTLAVRQPLCFVVARKYYNIPLVSRLFEHLRCVPVNRSGSEVYALREALRRLAAGRIMCIFPEGGLSNAGRGRLGRAKAGAAWLALRSGVPVVPALIAGGPQTWWIAQAWLRPGPWTRVRLGRPVDLSTFRGRRIDRPLLEEVARLLAERIEELRPVPKGGKAHGKHHDERAGPVALRPV